MLKQIFTWWSGHTINTAFDIKRRSRFIGEDDYGNRYFEDRKKSVGGRHRRFVMYRGLAEPSKVPAEWHGWLHHTLDAPPLDAPLPRKAWETDHTPNMTGTPFAQKPPRAGKTSEADPAGSEGYEKWTPDA